MLWRAKGIACILPDEAHQAMVMRVIYDNVKAGRPVEQDVFGEAASYLRKNGAECLILGCTELSLANRDQPLGSGCLDALEVLSRAAVLACGKPLRPSMTASLHDKRREKRLFDTGRKDIICVDLQAFFTNGWDGNREAVIRDIANRIRHRGPDQDDYYVDADIAMGFRRLSIIDLEGGSQPILNEDGTKGAHLQRRDLQLPGAAP